MIIQPNHVLTYLKDGNINLLNESKLAITKATTLAEANANIKCIEDEISEYLRPVSLWYCAGRGISNAVALGLPVSLALKIYETLPLDLSYTACYVTKFSIFAGLAGAAVGSAYSLYNTHQVSQETRFTEVQQLLQQAIQRKQAIENPPLSISTPGQASAA